jgi:flagellum-specific ATP synthase
MMSVTDRPHQQLASQFKELLATHRQAEDLINIGAYKQGSNPKIDSAIAKMDAMNSFIKQEIHEGVSVEDSIKGLQGIFGAVALT